MGTRADPAMVARRKGAALLLAILVSAFALVGASISFARRAGPVALELSVTKATADRQRRMCCILVVFITLASSESVVLAAFEHHLSTHPYSSLASSREYPKPSFR